MKHERRKEAVAEVDLFILWLRSTRSVEMIKSTEVIKPELSCTPRLLKPLLNVFTEAIESLARSVYRSLCQFLGAHELSFS